MVFVMSDIVLAWLSRGKHSAARETVENRENTSSRTGLTIMKGEIIIYYGKILNIIVRIPRWWLTATTRVAVCEWRVTALRPGVCAMRENAHTRPTLSVATTFDDDRVPRNVRPAVRRACVLLPSGATVRPVGGGCDGGAAARR